VEAVGDGHGGRVQLGFVLFSELQVDGGEFHSVFESLLLCLHAFNLSADARDLLFDLEDIVDLSGALFKNCAQSTFRFTGVLQARSQIGVLLRDFLAGLGFVLDAAKSLELANCGDDARAYAQTLELVVDKTDLTILCGPGPL